MARFFNKNQRATFVVECFEEFYREVLKHKKLVLAQPWNKAGKEEVSSPNATAEYILSQLQTFIENQAVKVSYGGGSYAENYYSQAEFIMVALADEVFLNMDWPGKAYWESNLLEQRCYNTHSAGQVFFDKLDTLLERKDPVTTDLAVLFLNALGLGFQGKYRHFDDKGMLSLYRKRLFTFINRREPYLFEKRTHLFPDAYSHTLEGSVTKELPSYRNWLLLFGGIGLVYLLASYIIWFSATMSISRVVDQIFAITRPGK